MCFRFQGNAKENQYIWLVVFFALPSMLLLASLSTQVSTDNSHILVRVAGKLFSICLFLNLTIVDDKVNDIDMHNRQHKIILEHTYFAH